MKFVRWLGCAALLCSFANAAYAQDEMSAAPDAADAPAVAAPATPPTKTDKTKDLPPSVEDVPLPPPAPPGTMTDQPIAELQALDKVTARTTHIEARTGETASFGSLTIQVKACRKSAPEDAPESAAFLVITQQSAGADPVQLYSGWMFASSPSLAAMDNPIYDIWLTECRKEPIAETAVK